MADTLVTSETLASAFKTTQELYVNDSGTDVKVNGRQILDLVGDSIGNASVANQAVSAATSTYLVGSSLPVPPAKLRIGTQFLWRMAATKTAAGVAARSFFIRIGTAGSTADTAVATLTSTSLPTAAIDEGHFEIIATIRGPLSSVCVIEAQIRMFHNGNTTGFAVIPLTVNRLTSSVTFDATVANLIVGLSLTSGSSEAITFTQISAESKNL